MKPFVVKCRDCGNHWMVYRELTPVSSHRTWTSAIAYANAYSAALTAVYGATP